MEIASVNELIQIDYTGLFTWAIRCMNNKQQINALTRKQDKNVHVEQHTMSG